MASITPTFFKNNPAAQWGVFIQHLNSNALIQFFQSRVLVLYSNMYVCVCLLVSLTVMCQDFVKVQTATTIRDWTFKLVCEQFSIWHFGDNTAEES